MILTVNNISKYFTSSRGLLKSKSVVIRALEGVSFQVGEFETLGLVGESGSGKTTLAKIILKLMLPTSGELVFDPGYIRDFRKDVQIIFQNPYNSLNPRMRILDILAEPLLIHKITGRRDVKDEASGLLAMVGLSGDILKRYPIEFSGGQRQRICIARALATRPKFIILDEPISSLDLTVQAQMLDLLAQLKERFKLTYIFISHNLAVIKHIADNVIVMKEGVIVEKASCEKIFNSPDHPYTKALLQAAKG